MARRTALVVDRDLGYRDIVREVERFQRSEILIGFQEGTITHVQTKGDRAKTGGLSMPQIAAENEFGTQRIPERSFMRTSFDENVTRIQALIRREYEQVVDGNKTEANALGLVGLYVVGLIQQKIRQITQPPNSPTTIAIKKSSKPLIDFGQMVGSVTYVVGRTR